MKKAFLVILSFSVGLLANAQTADDILNQYYENTGGVEKWKGMEDMISSGKAPSPQGEFPFTVYAKAPNMVKVSVSIQGKELIPQAYDGEVAWGLNPFAGGTTAQRLPEDITELMDVEAEFEPIYIDYKEKGHSIAYEGKEMVEGTETFKLKVVKNATNDKMDITEYHFFDTENYVPIMIKSTASIGPTKGVESETIMSDYQETEYGVIMPYYIETRNGGEVSQKIVIETITINSGIEDEVFSFPGGEDALDELEDIEEEKQDVREEMKDVEEERMELQEEMEEDDDK